MRNDVIRVATKQNSHCRSGTPVPRVRIGIDDGPYLFTRGEIDDQLQPSNRSGSNSGPE